MRCFGESELHLSWSKAGHGQQATRHFVNRFCRFKTMVGILWKAWLIPGEEKFSGFSSGHHYLI